MIEIKAVFVMLCIAEMKISFELCQLQGRSVEWLLSSQFEDIEVLKKWAFVTGATSGIGQATARQLAKLGYSLILGGRRQERLDQFCLEFKKQNVESVPACFDICDFSAVQKFCLEHSELIKQVSVLVNNAGLAKGSEKVQDASVADWDVMIDTNIKGLLYLTREILPAMIEKNTGDIINVGSVAGKWVYPGGAVYCASKFAVRALSEGLRMDLLGKNIRITNLEPGMVQTEFSEVRFGDKEKAKAVYQGMTPLSAEDMAESIVWCLSRPRHVNIQELVIFPTDQAAVGQVARKSF